MNKNMPMIIMSILMLASLFYAGQGIGMHIKVTSEEAKFHAANSAYFNNDKATRDSAPANSDLTNQLVEIKNYPSELLRLKLVGVGNILTGIFILLFAILMALMMMPKNLGAVLAAQKAKPKARRRRRR